MGDVKQLYKLQTDEEFLRLSFPLGSKDYKELEENIKKNGCNTPIRVWNSYVIMDFEKYEICHKNKIPFAIVKIPLKERIEVIALVCQLQIQERKMTEPMWRYLVGKRYECERVLGKHTIAKGSHTRKRGRPPTNTYQYDGSKLATRQRLGEEYHISEATVFKYGFFMQRIDELFKYAPELATYILLGKIKMSQEHLAELIKMTPKKLKEITGLIVDTDGKCKSYTKVREILDEYIPFNTSAKMDYEPQLYIKNTPDYDPDLEISSLALTIPSWISTINRTQKAVHKQDTSTEKRNTLIGQLLNLQSAVDDLLSIVKEML